MSTRRARIKAVTSLPPRRKNVENADVNKNKPVPLNENIEKEVRSPRTPRGSKSHEVLEKKSPAGRNASPRNSPYNFPKTPITPKVPSPTKIPIPVKPEKVKSGTPKLPEKVPVITNTATFRDNVFVSPLSPQARHIASPLIKTPRSSTESSVLKLIMPDREKLDTQVKSMSNELSKHIPSVVQKSNLVPESSNVAKETGNYVNFDYNVPSVPESITEDTMDGIVPLQAAASAPKPIALLKNEIISENAEVLFDPIVPLPSPSKVRPKLRPVPRLAPLRRNSIQGSASESEDESRRALLSSGSATPAPARQRHDSHTSHSTLHSIPNREVNRIRNDSVCSSVSQLNAPPPPAGSPVKEKHISKTRRQEMSRRMTAMRRRRETVKRDTLTMYDLIFYNPTTNPIVPDQDEIKANEANAKDAADIAAQQAEEEVDDPPQESAAAPVPQVKLGPNGEIILDEKSLVIKQSDTRKVSSVVREGSWAGSLGRYRRSARTAEWTDVETVRFYRALAAIGTDFTLMEPLFPGRTRRDLKLKFKKEEKTNLAQIDKALRTGAEWDADKLQKEFTSERELAEQRAAADRQRLQLERRAERDRHRAARALSMRTSKATRTLESSILPAAKHHEHEATTADEVIQRSLEAKERRKRKPVETEPIKFIPIAPSTPNEPTQFATLKVLKPTAANMAALPAVPKLTTPNITSTMPSNIESGSLVVLTVNDPNSPSKKMLQTYIAHGAGRLTPVALPTTLLNSVVGYMKKGTPKGNMSTGSSPLLSPNSVASHDSRTGSNPGVIQLNCSPAKRQRHSSYTITQL